MAREKKEVWNDEKKQALKDMKATYQAKLEALVNSQVQGLETAERMTSEEQRKRFSNFGFKAHTLYYREPEEYWNEVGLLVPEGLNYETAAPRPVHVFFMGGGFWTGDWKFYPWYLQAALRQAKDLGAVIFAINYPRLPLAEIRDITRAVDDFWAYFYSSDSINDYKKAVPDLKLDREKLLISGESAGAYLAAYSVLYPHVNDEGHQVMKVKALFLRYPMLRHYERLDRDQKSLKYMGHEFKKDETQETANKIWELVKTIRQEMKQKGLLGLADQGIFADIMERRTPPYGMHGAFTSSWCGTWTNYFGQMTDGETMPDILTQLQLMNKKNLRSSPLEEAPALFFYHGDADTQVTLEVSDTLEKEWKTLFKKSSKQKELKVRYDKVKDKAHGFDYTLDDTFINGFMADISKAWTYD